MAKTLYTPELAKTICDRIAEGDNLRAICREDGMPNWRTFYDWLELYPTLAEHFAHAREVGFDAIAAEALHIADTPQRGEKREESEEGVKVTYDDMLGHRKLQIETRLKLLAKWSPKKYGEKIQQELSNPDGTLSTLTEAEKAQRIAQIVSDAVTRKANGSDLV